MRTLRVLVPLLTMIVILALPLVPASTQTSGSAGAKPRQIAVTQDGTVALVTSWGSDYVTQLVRTGPGAWTEHPTEPKIYVGGHSWDVAIFEHAGSELAVISLPHKEFAEVLLRDSITGSFHPGPNNPDRQYPVPAFCTAVEVLEGSPARIFLANRGATPHVDPLMFTAYEIQDWQHAVYEYSFPGFTESMVYITDREPRVLAFSPDKSTLLVGHIQGSLGGPSIDPTIETPTNHISPDPISISDYDGGSIMGFDVTDGDGGPEFKVQVGSPVRGLATYEVPNSGGAYRVYYSHVGYGAQAEDPDFGGRSIPNLISNFLVDPATGSLSDRQDTYFDHTPDTEGLTTAILHEELLVEGTSLWCTNSASGTVLRASIVPGTGRLDCQTAPMLDPLTQLPLNFFGIAALDRSTQTHILTDDILEGDASFSDQRLVNASLLSTEINTSNPRGLALAGSDVLVAGQLADRVFVYPISGGTHSSVPTTSTTPDYGEELNFFTAGRGFDFREQGPQSGLAAPALPTNNISCGTCHVEGHLDGKVRLIARPSQNLVGVSPIGDKVLSNGKHAKPVQVPTIFDISSTEWIFFEGLTTIRDARDIDGTGGNATCQYCASAGFFRNTKDFTNDLASPVSPHAMSMTLDEDQLRGRFLFESMNCARCHGGTVLPFARANLQSLPPNDVATVNPSTGTVLGPMPGSGSNILADPTQVFLDLLNTQGLTDAVRNMTNVGTRPGSDGTKNGTNTPGLANLWDNRPYMHDGRYRTLIEVLSHTRLTHDGSTLAAAYVPDTVVPDNFANVSTGLPLTAEALESHSQQMQAFGVHKDASGALDVITHLAQMEAAGLYPDGDPESDLLSFLNALSSQTTLCGENDAAALLQDIRVESAGGNQVLRWNTTVPVRCTVTWSPSCESTQTTAWGSEHEVPLPDAPGAYTATLSPRMRTVCNEPIAAEFEVVSPGNPSQFVGTVSAPTEVNVCPAGDGDPLVLGIQMNGATGWQASDIWLCQASLGGLEIYDNSGGLIYADGPANSGNGFSTTLTISSFGGTEDPDPTDFVVMARTNGAIETVGSVGVLIRNPDHVAPYGTVGSEDFSSFGAAYGSCTGDPGFVTGLDFDSSGCIDISDFSYMGLHMDHSAGLGSSAASEQAGSTLLVRHSTTDDGLDLATLGLGGSGLASTFAARIAFDGDGPEAWEEPNAGGGSLLLTQLADNSFVLYAWNLDPSPGSVVAFRGRKIGAMRLVQGFICENGGAFSPIRQLDLEGEAPALVTGLLRSFPNPMRESTSIAFGLAETEAVTLSVYDVTGRKVRDLVAESMPAGEHTEDWDGTDDSGRRVAPGIYFYRLETSSQSFSRKLLVVR